MTPDLTAYDWIVVNSSGGKDSQTMLDEVVRQATLAGVKDRVVVVHADLQRVEWQGVRDLAERQARHYGVRFEVVRRPQGDLLQHVRQRRMWPSSTARYCTSDHKRGQVAKLFTQLWAESPWYQRSRGVRILNCLGLRAAESTARARRLPFTHDQRQSNTRRTVDTWLPIHAWSEGQVWERIRESGVEHHFAYDLGMPRLSCCFCIFAGRDALLLAGEHNPALLAQYVETEQAIGHTFKADLSLTSIAQALARGERADVRRISTWCM